MSVLSVRYAHSIAGRMCHSRYMGPSIMQMYPLPDGQLLTDSADKEVKMFGEAVKDWNGKILGWVETDSRGNQIVRNFSGKIVAKYDAQGDRTTDFAGRVLSRGNTAIAHIYTDK